MNTHCSLDRPGAETTRAAADGVDVSVVVVCWNNVGEVLDCLRHLRYQIGVGLELVVVDNGSTPGAKPLLQEHLTGATLIRSELNLGFAGGSNLGIQATSGRYVLSLNADVRFVDSGGVANMVRILDARPDVGLSNPCTLWPDGAEQPLPLKLPDLRQEVWEEIFWHSGIGARLGRRRGRAKEKGRDYAKNCDTDWARGACLFMRRRVLEEVGYFDDRFFFGHEEQDYSVRAKEAGWRLRYVGEVCVIHEASSSQALFGPELILPITASKYWFWRKHHGRLPELILRSVVLLRSLIKLLLNAVGGAGHSQTEAHRKLVLQAFGYSVEAVPLAHPGLVASP